jgi:hypothetical protein
MLLLQFLVLGFTMIVWWLARRDLKSRAGEVERPALDEWQRLQGAVQMLIAELEQRAAEAEQRIVAAGERLLEAEARLRQAEPSADDVLMRAGASARPAVAESAAGASSFVEPAAAGTEVAEADERFAAVSDLIASGVTDAAEIARRTGLGQSEVGLMLALHDRQRR